MPIATRIKVAEERRRKAPEAWRNRNKWSTPTRAFVDFVVDAPLSIKMSPTSIVDGDGKSWKRDKVEEEEAARKVEEEAPGVSRFHLLLLLLRVLTAPVVVALLSLERGVGEMRAFESKGNWRWRRYERHHLR